MHIINKLLLIKIILSVFLAISSHDVVEEYITYPGATGDVLAYLTKPKGAGSWPAVILVHDKEGIKTETEELARAIAARGYYVIVPDGLSQISGTPDIHDFVVNSMDQVDRHSTLRNFAAVIKFLEQNQSTTGKIACVGIGWGGAMARDIVAASDTMKISCLSIDDLLKHNLE